MKPQQSVFSDVDRDLLSFMNQYVMMLGTQLASARDDLATAFDEVMRRLVEIDRSQDTARGAAELWLEKTYLSSDATCPISSNPLQKDVDRIMDQGGSYDPSAENKKQNQNTEGVAGIEKIESELSNSIMHLVAALSADDVTAQKLQHIEFVLKNLKIELESLMKVSTHTFANNHVTKFKSKLLKTAATAHSTTTEHQIFSQYFPEFTKKTA